jgi:hypothetical protein
MNSGVQHLLFLLLFGLDLRGGILALPCTLLLLLHFGLRFTGRLRRGRLGKISCGLLYITGRGQIMMFFWKMIGVHVYIGVKSKKTLL